MNINDLTIGELRELQSLIGGQQNKTDIFSRYIGKYVICRSRNEGVNAGKVIALDETGVILDDARRLHYHKPINKNVSWYEGVAKYGIDKSSRLGTPIEKVLVEDYSLTICTSEAEKSIRKAKDHEQS
jgi:hypothetical protein